MEGEIYVSEKLGGGLGKVQGGLGKVQGGLGSFGGLGKVLLFRKSFVVSEKF